MKVIPSSGAKHERKGKKIFTQCRSNSLPVSIVVKSPGNERTNVNNEITPYHGYPMMTQPSAGNIDPWER
jgi:hypothetical protein